jgi:hypothetical protein
MTVRNGAHDYLQLTYMSPHSTVKIRVLKLCSILIQSPHEVCPASISRPNLLRV